MINQILIERNCFMAHCFTLESNFGSFYERLNYSILNSSTHKLCTSTIHIDDTAFDNYFGGIGLIIKNPEVLFASPQDGGTWRLDDGTFIYDDDFGGVENPAKDDIDYAINNRQQYNEFVVQHYEPIGIFMSLDTMGLDAVTKLINNNFLEFHERTKHHKLPYYYVRKGILSKAEFNEIQNSFASVARIHASELYV